MFRRKQPSRPMPPLPPPPAQSSPRPPMPPPQPQLSPAQLRRIDWIEEDEQQHPLAKRPTTYVPSASDIIQMPSVVMASPDAHVDAQVTPFATIESKTFGGHSDRARAWIRYALPLCGTAAFVMTVMAWTLGKVPILSFWSLLVFGLTFVLSYTLLLMDYWRHTPEGVALDSSKQLWGFLRAEQQHRHGIERQAWDMQQRRIEEKRNVH